MGTSEANTSKKVMFFWADVSSGENPRRGNFFQLWYVIKLSTEPLGTPATCESWNDFPFFAGSVGGAIAKRYPFSASGLDTGSGGAVLGPLLGDHRGQYPFGQKTKPQND